MPITCQSRLVQGGERKDRMRIIHENIRGLEILLKDGWLDGEKTKIEELKNEE